MTASQDQTPSLDDVLEEIAASTAPPDAQQFRSWVNRYPQFKAEIVDFATDWIEMEVVETGYDVTRDDVDLVVNRTMSRVQQLLDEAKWPTSLSDLAADIEAAGHDLDSFQRTVGIDRSILTCLLERMIRPVTIPLRMVMAMAQALNREAEPVRDYLRLPPQLDTPAYKARSQPELQQRDFVDIVTNSTLPEAQKKCWLAEPPDPAFSE